MAETTTTRLGLVKPTPATAEPVDVADHLNGNWDKIDAAIGATVCTSGTRPGTPYDGQIIRETDTRRVYVRNNTQSMWEQVLGTNSTFDGSLSVVNGSISTTGNLTVGGDASITGYPASITKRITQQIETSNSAGVTTTETAVITVTASLQTGRTYRVKVSAAIDTTVAGDTVDCRLRENNATGTEMQLRRVYLHDNTGRWPVEFEAEFTAVSTGNKTFVFTLDRFSGTGTITTIASATIPSYLIVDYVRG